MIARSFRYYVEGILAVFYGRRVLLFMKDNGLVILSIVGALVLVAGIAYLLINRRRIRLPVSPDDEAAGAHARLEKPDTERAAD
jgi:hypothetical protein